LLTLSVARLPKKYQHQVTCVKVIASQRWDVFLETRCIYSLSGALAL